MHGAWLGLTDELDRWHDAGRAASLWWRDDDAVASTPALERLLGMAREYHVEVAVAVIPAGLEASLGECLERFPAGRPVQHGWAHVNHAPADQKSAELGDHRDPGLVIEELERGWQALRAHCDPLPAMVPPWNRVSETVVSRLRAAGYALLSRYGARAGAQPSPGLREVNCHLDVIDWKGSRGFKGTARTLADLCTHLKARRLGNVDTHEPSGLLTHHLVHDDGVWDFLNVFLRTTRAHPGARWLTPREALAD